MTTYTSCIWDKDKVLKLLETLSQEYTVNLDEFIIGSVLRKNARLNYFEVLVAIILSQNTSDKNAIKAFKNLKNTLKSITPEKIIEMPENHLKELIKVAGLTHRRVKVLKELAFKISKECDLLIKLKSMSIEEAREELLKLPGVGFKTADVFLLMVLNKPTFPIDTHINRVIRRLGLASSNDDYENIRIKIMNYLENDVEKLKYMHFLLIIHGRNICKARNPLCSRCNVANICCKRID